MPKQVSFVTRSGRSVSFYSSGARKRKLEIKIASGRARCKINPATGRAVREGSKTYRRVKRLMKGVRRYPGPESNFRFDLTRVRREIEEAQGNVDFTEI